MNLKPAAVVVMFFSSLSLSSQENRGWDIYTDWSDIHDIFFEEMSLQEQVEFYCVYFDDPRYYGAFHSKNGLAPVSRYFENQEDEKAIPYFFYHFATKELPVFNSPEETYYDIKRLANIIGLIDYKARVMKNLDVETALKFASLAEGKVMEYIVRNRRIDANVDALETYVQFILGYAKGLQPIDWLPKEWEELETALIMMPRYFGELIYNKYVVKNGLEYLDVGIESPFVFEGYTGRVITPDDPGYLGEL